MAWRIGLVIGSTRPGCNGRAIGEWVYELVKRGKGAQCTYTLIDLAEWNLPIFNEPKLPMKAPPVHDHTKAWSEHIKSFDAFIFITPQYNWGYPASLKNALDYLFPEWNGKPAGIISYGGRGGGKAAAHLAEVLQGLRMKFAGSLSTICLSEDHAFNGGLTVEEARSSFADSAAGITNLASLVEAKLKEEPEA